MARAWVAVCANNGAPGIDKITLPAVKEYGIDRPPGELASELEDKRYRPLPARRVPIPSREAQRTGRCRFLLFADRIVQAAVKIVLEPVFEADMLDCSFGFRPRRSAHDALQVLIDECCGGGAGGWSRRTSPPASAIPHEKLVG